MNKKRLIITILILIEIVSVFLMYKSRPLPQVLEDVKLVSNDKSMFAMYIKNGETFEEYTDSNKFPTGYNLNLEKSKCIDNNGDEAKDTSLQIENGKVKVKSNRTIYCYLYFEDTMVPSMTLFNMTGTGVYGSATGYMTTPTAGYKHSTKVNVKAQYNDDDVKEYCFGTDENSCPEYKSVLTHTSTSKGTTTLEVEEKINDVAGEQTWYLYIKDKAGNVSTPLSSSINYDNEDPVASDLSAYTEDRRCVSISISASGCGNAGCTMGCEMSGYTGDSIYGGLTCSICGEFEYPSQHYITAWAIDESGRESSSLQQSYQHGY